MSRPLELTLIDDRVVAVTIPTALEPSLVDDLLTGDLDTPERRPGGWAKGSIAADHFAARVLAEYARVAERHLARPIVGFEPVELHRYGAGSCFPVHVDRMEAAAPSSQRAGTLGELLATRSANVVALLQPAHRGGHLRFWPAPDPAEPITPDLEAGDVIVFDSAVVHEVTRIDAGERVTLVTHAHDA